MKVKWSERANYIRREFGAKRKYIFKQEIRNTTDLLKRSPGIGQIDPLFANRAATYRSVIINGLNKLVYRVDEDTIHIVAFWDTRKEPTDEAAQTK